MRRFRLLPALLALALAVGLSACGGDDTSAGLSGPTGAITAIDPASGDRLPQTELSVLGSDETIDTASWIGTPLVVNFWAQWCGPCREEMPDLEAAHQALGDRVHFVGVDYEDRAQAALDFIDEVGVTYDVVEDPDGAFFQAVRGRGTPQTLLVDADGVIRWRHAGPVTEEQLRDLLSEHLGIPNA